MGHTAGHNGLDDDAGTASPGDAKAQSAAVIVQVDHFHLRPFTAQLYQGKDKQH